MLISMVIPVYNTKPEFIEEAIESTKILSGLCDYEVIIVNDGSTAQETIKYLAYLESLNLYSVVHQENKGLPGARNTGISQAKGTYIFPLDSDDRVSKQVSYFIRHISKNYNKVQVIYGDLPVFGTKQKFCKLETFHPLDLLFQGNKVSACSIFHRDVWDIVGGYDEEFKTIEDWDFWCKCAMKNIEFVYLPYANYEYRIIEDGQSLGQRTVDLFQMYHKKTLEKFNLAQVEPMLHEYINQNLRKQFRRKKRKAVALLIYTFCPKLYYALCKFGLFSYKDHFYDAI